MEDAKRARHQAEKARWLSGEVGNAADRENLLKLADELEREAVQAEADQESKATDRGASG